MSISYVDRVAIVTGSGSGLGRSHALQLAARGAKVVVNDFGGSRDGTGGSAGAAEQVVSEIKAAGGEAIANFANVTSDAEVQAMVEQTMDTWGRVDVLVNNAGILRDKSFAKLQGDDWRAVVDVHLNGAANCSRAVWPVMREQSYGRIVMTTSTSGIYGNFGQANYGAAKSGVVGLMNVLHIEGEKYDIRVNCLAPTAATRMTVDVMSEEMLESLAPEHVTPAVLFLASENGPKRTVLLAGAGCFTVAKLIEAEGIYLEEENRTPEQIAEKFSQMCDLSNAREMITGSEHVEKILSMARQNKH
ncbi:3-oxoacyl-ACP reductase [Chromatiales bacterium (ex Bugula neritina AB1)]|nr:3-oxoacyl-ACP reductase [Chromatiales bacterium (ex Bugula neritina AB1)]